MKATIDNRSLTLLPETAEEEEFAIEFREETSIMSPGYRNNPRYLMGQWDGRIRFVKSIRRGKTGFTKWRAPIGMFSRALSAFGELDIIDKRRVPTVVKEISFNPEVVSSLRQYQEEAVEAFCEDRGLFTGKGNLLLPTRSGKTVIAGGIICKLGVRTMFLVPSKMLLNQTFEFYKKALQGDVDGEPLIGKIGEGEFSPGFITVASIQTLIKRGDSPEVKAFLRGVDLAIFDECHHLTGDEWRKPLLKSDAFYKLSLSATIDLDDSGEISTFHRWLELATGEILFSLEPSDLIEAGWLCRPRITFVDSPDPQEEIYLDDPFATKYRVGIVENFGRNKKIAELAKRHVLAGERVLVTAKQVKHVNRIVKALKAKGLSVAKIIGSTKEADRVKQTEWFRTGRRDVMVGTVFGEGVDLPWLDVVIIGGGLKSMTLTLQRLRNLTPYEKDTGRSRRTKMSPAEIVQVYDFADWQDAVLQIHSLERYEIYRANRAFILLHEEDPE